MHKNQTEGRGVLALALAFSLVAGFSLGRFQGNTPENGSSGSVSNTQKDDRAIAPRNLFRKHGYDLLSVDYNHEARLMAYNLKATGAVSDDPTHQAFGLIHMYPERLALKTVSMRIFSFTQDRSDDLPEGTIRAIADNIPAPQTSWWGQP